MRSAIRPIGWWRTRTGLVVPVYPVAGASPAVTATVLTSGSDLVDRTTYTTASITPTANALILIAVATNDPAQAPSSVVGNGITYTQIATVAFASIAASFHQLTLLRGLNASPSSGTVAINFGSTASRCDWAISEFGSVDTGGTNGSTAVVQSQTNRADSGTSLTVTLGAFGSVNNATFGCFQTNANSGHTPGTGFTELTDASLRLATEWRVDNDTSVDYSGYSGAWAGVAVEIKEAVAAIKHRRTLLGVGV